LLFDLADGDPAIGAIKHPFDEPTLWITRAKSKLWHVGGEQ
jgi:hypothetical protein